MEQSIFVIEIICMVKKMILVPGINPFIFRRDVTSDLFLIIIIFDGSKKPRKYKY